MEMRNSEGKKIELIVRKITKDEKVVSLDRPRAASQFRILDILSTPLNLNRIIDLKKGELVRKHAIIRNSGHFL
jgi:hypothetical protein